LKGEENYMSNLPPRLGEMQKRFVWFIFFIALISLVAGVYLRSGIYKVAVGTFPAARLQVGEIRGNIPANHFGSRLT
jgi:hypothetical protein